MVFDKYLFHNILIATIFMSLTLAAIIFLSQSLRFLELVIESGASSKMFWILTFLALPRFLEVVVPIALMAATLFTYNRLIMDSELVVMRNAGYSPLRLSRPVIMLSIFTTIFLLLVTTWLAPVSLNQMQQLRLVLKSQYSTLLIKEGVFNGFGDHLTVYVEDRKKDGEMEGLLIHDTNPDWDEPVTIVAQRGYIVASEQGQQVIVEQGWRQSFNAEGGNLDKLSFERYSIDLPESEDVRQRWTEPDERTFLQLLNPDPNVQRDMESKDQFLTEAHRRIVTPFLAMTYTFLSLSFLLLGPLNRRGQAIRIAMAIGSVVIIQGLYLSAFNLSNRSVIGLIGMYVLVFVPLILAWISISPMSEAFRRKTLFKKKENPA
ncbi:MAG: LPS export ABC transporter permease LptF [Pseudomonadota bacterium]